jgi:hypothetical protein
MVRFKQVGTETQTLAWGTMDESCGGMLALEVVMPTP